MNETFELIKKEIEREGIENVIFIHKLKGRNGKFPYVTLSEPEEVECHIWIPNTENELHNELYNFYGDYKMYLKAKDESFGKEDFYVSDFISLVNKGIIKWIRSSH